MKPEALRAQENYAAAETEYRAVLTIQEQVLGPEHPHTLASHFRLGLSLGKQGDQHFRQNDTAAALRLWTEGLTHAQAAQQAGARVLSAEDPQQQKYWKAVEDLQGRLNRHGAP
jgi:Tetratricopeptide repeat